MEGSPLASVKAIVGWRERVRRGAIHASIRVRCKAPFGARLSRLPDARNGRTIKGPYSNGLIE